jgi:hypothetical protein
MEKQNIPLPYPYAENSRAGSVRFYALAGCVTALLLFIKLLGAALPWAVVLTPGAIVCFRVLMFEIVRNATHEALRHAAADNRLDYFIQNGVLYAKEHGMAPDDLVEEMENVTKECDI